MRTAPDQRLPRLRALLDEGRKRSEAGEPREALQAYRALERQLGALHLGSAWLEWLLAVTHDSLEDFPMAMTSIRRALELDPLDPGCRSSFALIVRRIRDHLHGLPVSDPSIPRLYRLVQESGEVDVPTHLVLVRHHLATGHQDQAEALLDALCLLAPASRDLWRERARLARRRGDLAAAAGFEAEAQVRALEAVPHAIPEA
jgi:tetratricopeptide (TPR) repeat protein